MSLENLFPRSFTNKRAFFSQPLREALARDTSSDANAVHFGHQVKSSRNEIYSDMSPRDIVSMLSR